MRRPSGAFKQTTRKSHSISGERARSRGLQAMFFEPIVQIGRKRRLIAAAIAG